MNYRSVCLALLTVVFGLPAAQRPSLPAALRCSLPATLAAEMRFEHHFGDRHFSGSAWGQTALADLDGDGDLDFITGQSGGDVIWYEYHAADRWTRHLLGRNSPSEVGGAVLDVNRDGRPDFVAGGAWYENPSDPSKATFKRHTFDAKLTKVHDLRIADLDGDTIPDVVTMSDRNDVRWYKVAADPTAAWKATTIGPSVHSGICTGDVDADGDTDVVRSNVWFENLQAGRKWVSHRMTEPWGDAAIPWQDNATQTRTCDLNGDGRLDVVIADGENRNARIGWLQAPSDPKKGRWITHLLPKTDTAARGAYHCLHVGDFNGDGRPDVFSAEMELFAGDRPPRWFVWENVDGKGNFREHVVLDANLGAHEAVCGDVDADGDLDVCSKLWRPIKSNANEGRNHFDFLENLAK